MEGLDYALRGQAKYAADMRYTGVDIVNWGYRAPLRAGVRFLNQDIAVWQRFDDDRYNVIMFPKSIAEFPDPVFERLLEIIRDSAFACNRVCLLCSLMCEGRHYDTTRFRKIVDVMTERHGFACAGDPGIFYHYPEDQGIRKVESSWIYPQVAKDMLGRLLEMCPERIANGHPCRPDECKILNRQPMMRTPHFGFKVLGLARNGVK